MSIGTLENRPFEKPLLVRLSNLRCYIGDLSTRFYLRRKSGMSYLKIKGRNMPLGSPIFFRSPNLRDRVEMDVTCRQFL